MIDFYVPRCQCLCCVVKYHGCRGRRSRETGTRIIRNEKSEEGVSMSGESLMGGTIEKRAGVADLRDRNLFYHTGMARRGRP